VAVLAGIWEEVTWRGVQPVLMAHVLQSEFSAVLLCAILFAVAHATQGWRSAGLITVLAFAFHLLVLLTGSLYAAMAVHVAYDITAGLTLGRFAREQGHAPPQA
jgi:membrane protease YdiL (CAAX protease family)